MSAEPSAVLDPDRSEHRALDPANAAELRHRGIVLRKLGRLPQALESFEAALALRPDDADLLVKRSMVLNEIDRREEALSDIQRALALRPDDLDVLNARVIVLDNLERYTEALQDVDRMLGMQPEHLDAINNTGMLLARLGRFREALRCYDRSLSLQADQPQARYNHSLIRLALGDWIGGFQEFESRWHTAPLNRTRIPGLGPLWLGEQDLAGKTLLLYHEQGYGDTLQSVRYVPLLVNRGARVVLAVPAALQALMRTLPGVTRVLSGNDALPPHDYQSPLMSLPLSFRTTPDTVPAPIPYLAADPASVAKWRDLLGRRTRPRIGLAWGGRRYAPINYPRDLPLAALRPLFELEADFISLQKEIADSDRPLLAALPQIRPLGETLDDFADTAGLIANLDLVITVDTAVVHLAGALGKPVWLMNRHASCWRWLQQRTDSPWYPSLRQFRQPAVGDWTSVVSAVREAAASALTSGCSAGGTLGFPPGDCRLPLAAPPTTGRPHPGCEKIRFVTATRLSTDAFFAQSALGRSLPLYRGFPKRQTIELRLFPNNVAGLPSIYNRAIDEAGSDPAILVFIHDDVYLSDYHWAGRLHEALRSFDLVGLVGNQRRVPRQASWMYLDDHFTSDDYDNFSGVLGHGEPFPDLRQLSVYGEPGQEVKLLDGVMLAIRSQVLVERDLRFDERFTFHFYDMDFCRQAELRQLRMGTCALSLVHASAGRLGVESWRLAYRDYLAKYGEGPPG